MVDQLPDQAIKGRGAVSNASGRFETHSRVRVDDGWSQGGGSQSGGSQGGADAGEGEDAPSPATILLPDRSRTVISYNDSPDVPFDRSINPYRGCEHGCVYCFARPSHAYLGHSPGLDFETRLYVKRDAASQLARELRAPGYRCRPLALGANTDPYQPVERAERVTRGILEVLAEFRHPVTIVTKAHLVTRDIDVIAPMAAAGLASVAISVTTLDRDLARRLEPRAPTPARRLDAIRQLSEAGIPVSVLASPMIPGLNDAELDDILLAAADAGAVSASYILLRLPRELAGLMEEWLQVHAPVRAEKIMNLIRECRQGQIYESAFGRRMKGTGPYADMLAQRFKLALHRLGLTRRRRELDTTAFRAPPGPGDQLTLF